MSTKKYPSGYEKLKNKEREELIESQKGATNLLLVKNKILQKI